MERVERSERWNAGKPVWTLRWRFATTSDPHSSGCLVGD